MTMKGAAAARCWQKDDDLFDRIGAFLAEQRLSIDPAHYAFAHHVLSDPDGTVASAVARLTDGGIRLQRSDIEQLGGQVVSGPSTDRTVEEAAQQLVADTQAHVDGFAIMMREIQDETRGFGLDLANSAAAISRVPAIAGIDEIARITGTMLARIRETESRLAVATRETEALRDKLAEANDTARRDVLTGLPNRRAFEEAFAARDLAAGPYCLALCDIDRFKRVNDDHGHAIGDRVLAAVGRKLAEECAPHLVVRHGGEEFVILFQGTDLAAAHEKLDDVRTAIGTKRFRIRETDSPLGKVTISVGVTTVANSDPASIALDRADQLLYQAKAAGRDCIKAA